MSDFTFTRRDASPADWGAVPGEPEGPEKWGAIPLKHHEKNAPGMVSGVGQKMATPPPGFALDQQPAGKAGPNPPPDFVLDKPTEKTNRAYNLDSEKEKSETPGLVSGAGRAFARGAPIVGGLLNKADAATNAGLSYVLNPMFDEKDQLHGSLGERYQQSLDTQNKMDEAFHKEHPALDTAAELGGGIASTGGIAKTALGAKALGLTPKTLPGLMAAGAGSGGVIGGTDALTRGEDPLAAGGVGLATGLVAPGAGRVVNSLARPVTSAVRGALDPLGEAAHRVSGAIARDAKAGSAGLTEPEFLAAQSAGVPVNLMDAGGETTRALARSAANTSPEGRAILNKSIDDRFEAQANRFEDYLNSTFHYPDPIEQQAAQYAAYRESAAPAYQKAYRDGDREIWSPELERLTAAPMVQDALNGAMSKWKNYAVRDGFGAMNPPFRVENGGLIKTGGGMKAYPNLQLWDYTARELQDAARNAAPGTQQAGLYNDLARSLKNELDKQVPSYKNARETALDYFQARDAMQAGVNFATSRKVFNNNQARLALAQMTDTRRKLFQDGFVGAYIDRIRNMPDRSNVAGKIMNSPNAREQMEIALGRQRANELQTFTHVENIMDAARNAVQGNSTTARQLVELGLAGGFGGLETGNNPFTDPEAFMHSALVFGALRGHAKINERVSRQVAQLLTSDDLSKVGAGIKILSQRPDLANSIRHADAAISSVLARGSLPATEWEH
jgi:hypothetical protein